MFFNPEITKSELLYKNMFVCGCLFKRAILYPSRHDPHEEGCCFPVEEAGTIL